MTFSECTKGARRWGTGASAAAQQGAHENQPVLGVLGCSKLPSREFSGGILCFMLILVYWSFELKSNLLSVISRGL